jgi:hypothetical protein
MGGKQGGQAWLDGVHGEAGKQGGQAWLDGVHGEAGGLRKNDRDFWRIMSLVVLAALSAPGMSCQGAQHDNREPLATLHRSGSRSFCTFKIWSLRSPMSSRCICGAEYFRGPDRLCALFQECPRWKYADGHRGMPPTMYRVITPSVKYIPHLIE